MYNLPTDVLNQIYYYKHQLEYNAIMDELLEAKIKCRFGGLGLSFARHAMYLSQSGQYVKCLNVQDFEVSPREILYKINKNYI